MNSIGFVTTLRNGREQGRRVTARTTCSQARTPTADRAGIAPDRLLATGPRSSGSDTLRVALAECNSQMSDRGARSATANVTGRGTKRPERGSRGCVRAAADARGFGVRQVEVR